MAVKILQEADTKAELEVPEMYGEKGLGRGTASRSKQRRSSDNSACLALVKREREGRKIW